MQRNAGLEKEEKGEERGGKGNEGREERAGLAWLGCMAAWLCSLQSNAQMHKARALKSRFPKPSFHHNFESSSLYFLCSGLTIRDKLIILPPGFMCHLASLIVTFYSQLCFFLSAFCIDFFPLFVLISNFDACKIRSARIPMGELLWKWLQRNETDENYVCVDGQSEERTEGNWATWRVDGEHCSERGRTSRASLWTSEELTRNWMNDGIDRRA